MEHGVPERIVRREVEQKADEQQQCAAALEQQRQAEHAAQYPADVGMFAGPQRFRDNRPLA
jgi:hypothetical protein